MIAARVRDVALRYALTGVLIVASGKLAVDL